jgi:hypothetical protein
MPDGTKEERDDIQPWEVAPDKFDQYEKGFATEALSQVPDGAAKTRLQQKITERRAQGQIKMVNVRYKGQLAENQDKLITASTAAANAGNDKGAAAIIGLGVKNGTFTLTEGRKMTREILEAGDENRARRALLETNDTGKLEELQMQMLRDSAAPKPGEPYREPNYPNLPPLKRASIIAAIDTKRIELEKAGMVTNRRNERANIEKAGIDLRTAVQAGATVSPEQAAAKIASMPGATRDDVNGAIRDVTSGAEIKTTPAGQAKLDEIYKELDNLSALGSTPEGKPVEPGWHTENANAALTKLYGNKQISVEDRDKMAKHILDWGNGVFHAPKYKEALTAAEKYIVPTSDRRSKKQALEIENQFKADLREWRRGNLKGDPVTWVHENAARYVARQTDGQYRALSRLGAAPFIMYTSDGKIDVVKTVAALEASGLPADKMKEAINTVSPELERK